MIMTEEEIMKMREDVLDGKLKKWDVIVDEGTPTVKGSGYFGNMTIITVGGKKTLVFCDPRDAICVPMLGDWYDDIAMTEHGWDVDTRFQSNPNWNPLLVKKDYRWTMIGYCGNIVKRGSYWVRIPYCDKWYSWISNMSRIVNGVRCYEAADNGLRVWLTTKCQVVEENASDVMKQVTQWDKDRIVKDWIGKGKPCYRISGFRYKGAKAKRITNVEALNLIKVHHFGTGFRSLDWNVEDGRVALVFESYSESDME